jgi:2-polyprenyl-6-methoxyphenol hydroxylase-like FAD-dependent oxidoreductase
MNDYDVVVVGARVAGAATALLLARAGLRVAVLDRGAYGSDTLSTHALMRAGVLQLSRWGVLDRVVAAGTPPVHRVGFHYPALEPVHVSIKPSAGVDALYAPRRHLLDRILVDAAVAAGADVLHGTTVTGLVRDGVGRVLGVRGTGAKGELVLRAAVTVGADGIRSVVAREAGAPVDRRGHAASAVLYRHVTGLPVGGYEWAYGASAAAGLIPTNEGRTVVFVSTTPRQMRALRKHGTDAAFRALLARAAPAFVDRVAAAAGADRTHGWAGVAGFVRRSWGPGWALVGDAGYFKDPITAHGMTDALRDAELLADQVLEALVGETPEPLALCRYQTTRDRLSHRMFEATEAVAAYDWDVDAVQRLLRQVSSSMSDEVELLESRGRDRLGNPLGSAWSGT